MIKGCRDAGVMGRRGVRVRLRVRVGFPFESPFGHNQICSPLFPGVGVPAGAVLPRERHKTDANLKPGEGKKLPNIDLWREKNTFENLGGNF